MRKMAIVMVISSAAGTAIHTPLTPKISGRVRRNTVISPKVRKNDRNAERFPSDNAVKAAEAKILMPQKRKAKGKIEKPSLVIA